MRPQAPAPAPHLVGWSMACDSAWVSPPAGRPSACLLRARPRLECPPKRPPLPSLHPCSVAAAPTLCTRCSQQPGADAVRQLCCAAALSAAHGVPSGQPHFLHSLWLSGLLPQQGAQCKAGPRAEGQAVLPCAHHTPVPPLPLRAAVEQPGDAGAHGGLSPGHGSDSGRGIAAGLPL